MSVKIRLTRMGKKKQPSYRVVVVDSRKPRDGAYLEQIGRYDPRAEPSLVEIDNERALDWLQKGAQPTERAKKLLEISGAWTRFAIDRGEIHTVGASTPEPEPVTEPVAAVAEVEEEPVTDDSAEKVDE
jgi:small subunit ribosomal protein S16